ncbi:MAG: hypothetical protein AAGA33_08050 [Pseudomonadota bacterium]
MRMVLLMLVTAALSGCSSQTINRDDPEVMKQSMIFVWDDDDPCVLSCIRVGSDRQCSGAADGDPCTLTGDDRFPTACVAAGEPVRLGSDPTSADFRIFFRPYQSTGRLVRGTGRSVTPKRDALRVKYKFTAIRTIPECRRRPNDPHIRVTDTDTDATLGRGSGTQTPPTPPTPPGPVEDPDSD